jgi:hypothetical protein
MRHLAYVSLALALLVPAASALTVTTADPAPLALTTPTVVGDDGDDGGEGGDGSTCNVPESSGLGPYSRGYDTYLGFAVGNCGPVGDQCDFGDVDICDSVHLARDGGDGDGGQVSGADSGDSA